MPGAISPTCSPMRRRLSSARGAAARSFSTWPTTCRTPRSSCPTSCTRSTRAQGLDSQTARIYGLIEQLDAAVGRLLRTLDDEGQHENSLVIFMSDNGGVSRHYRAGLRGGKGSVYEGGVRSPFFARWPGKFEAGRKTAARATHLDLFPTLAEIAEAETPSDRALDGRSLLPLLTGETDESPHPRLFHIWDRHRPSLKSRWAVAGPRYKLVGDELYDLRNDSGEQRDIAAEAPDIAAQLRREFTEWLTDVTAGQTFEPLPIPVGDPRENPVDLLPSWARHKGRHASVVHPYHRGPTEPAALGEQAAEDSTVYTFGAYYWDTIEGWREPGETVAWKLDIEASGTYDITLVYGCDLTDAGGEYRVRVGDQAIAGKVHPTTGRSFFEARRIGSVRLGAGPAVLRVAVVSASGRDLMALNRVRLERR